MSNEGIANRHFEEIEELEEALVERCVALCDQPELIRFYIRYRWWPEVAWDPRVFKRTCNEWLKSSREGVFCEVDVG